HDQCHAGRVLWLAVVLLGQTCRQARAAAECRDGGESECAGLRTGCANPTPSLAMTFYTASAFPSHYRGGVFIGQHGSWNRAHLAGYKVVYVPFKDGKPNGMPEDFLTGFLADPANSSVAYGRP